MNKNQILISKKNLLLELKKKYESTDPITWIEFNVNQFENRERVIYLYQDDFKHGTIRVKQPCMIKLMEDISFNPNRPKLWLDYESTLTPDFSRAVGINPNRDNDWFPDSTKSENLQYFEPEVRFAYNLGFFAAITIECPNVIVDLNAFTLQQHIEHTIQQRFYANIELADQPFIPFQGPSNFGYRLRTARNVWIFNGKIGRSSHHGIHGNDADEIFIEDVEFEDFEVAALALNGSKNICLENLIINKNKRDVHVRATYSQGRFIRLFVKTVQNRGLSTQGLDDAVLALNTSLDQAFNYIIFGKGSMPILFENPTGLIDGNAYGILINPKGIAVNSFMVGRNSEKANQATNIVINNCSINGIHANVHEIVAVGNELGNGQVDTAGALLQFFYGVSIKYGTKWFYRGTDLSNVQIELARIKHQLNDAGENTSFFGTMNITNAMVIWKDDPDTYFVKNDNYKLVFMKNDEPVLDGDKEIVYDIFCNGDSMFHVNKGVIGIKIDGASGICINNCNISDIKNIGIKGSLLTKTYITSHPAQGTMIGYHGCKVYGMTCCAVNDMECNNININNIESKYNSSTGIAVMNETLNSKFNNAVVKDIKSAVETNFNPAQNILPNELPIGCALYVGYDCKNITVSNIDISKIQNSIGNPYNKPLDINCKINMN